MEPTPDELAQIQALYGELEQIRGFLTPPAWVPPVPYIMHPQSAAHCYNTSTGGVIELAKLKEYVAAGYRRKAELEAQLEKICFPVRKETGTARVLLPGFVAVEKTGKTVKIDVGTVTDCMTQKGMPAGIETRLVTWEASLVAKEWKKLSAEQKEIMAPAMTTKTGTLKEFDIQRVVEVPQNP